MADNFNILEQTVDDKITNSGGPGSILASDHNEILKEFIQKSGKYTGSPYKARKEPTGGIVPVGTFFWNNNAMNNTSDFVITVSKTTADLNDLGLQLNRMSSGDLIHFKDYSGRSVYLIYKSHVAGTDASLPPPLDTYEITVAGLAENVNYTYQSSDDEISVMEFLPGNSKVIPFGQLQIFKASGNTDLTQIEAGDTAIGQLNADIFLMRGVYVSGPILDVTSYDDTQSDWFDPNDV